MLDTRTYWFMYSDCFRLLHQLVMKGGFYFDLTKQLFLLNSFLSKCPILCPFGYLVMKQKAGLKPHTFPLTEISASLKAIRSLFLSSSAHAMFVQGLRLVSWSAFGWTQGTTFVLQKNIEPQQRLLQAISIGQGVEEVISLHQECISFCS